MTLAQAIEIRDEVLANYRKALKGKSYNLSGGATAHSYTRQDVDKLRAELNHWNSEVKRLSGGTSRFRVGVGA